MTPVTVAEIDKARDACRYALDRVREQHAAGRDTRLEREILNDRRIVVERLLAGWWAQGCREPEATCPTCNGSGDAPMSLRAPKTQDEVIALCRQGAQWCHLCTDFGCTDNSHPQRANALAPQPVTPTVEEILASIRAAPRGPVPEAIKVAPDVYRALRDAPHVDVAPLFGLPVVVDAKMAPGEWRLVMPDRTERVEVHGAKPGAIREG